MIQGRLGIVWLASNCIGEVFVYCQLELNTFGGLSVRTGKYTKHGSPTCDRQAAFVPSGFI